MLQTLTLTRSRVQEIQFPSRFDMMTSLAVTPWYAPTPDDNAFRYAHYARCARTGAVPNVEESVMKEDTEQLCSSLVCATWQAALGSMAPEGSEAEQEMLNQLPMHAAWAKPTDWSHLPQKSENWSIVGVVQDFSQGRNFKWYNYDD